MEVPRKNMYNFTERVPMIRHIVARMDVGNMIKKVWKIMAFVFLLFWII